MVNIYAMFGYGILFLIIGEVIYIYMCKESSLKKVRNDWIFYKFISFIASGIIVFGLWGVMNFLRLYGLYTLLTIAGIVAIILFSYLNKKIGLHFAKKNKHKTKLKKRKNN